VAAALRTFGGQPVIAPMINFAGIDEDGELRAALDRLSRGKYDWLVVTSATTVDVLVSHGTSVPDSTRIAAVGETTASALGLAGYRVEFVPESDNSARGLVHEWPRSESGRRVLVPQSDISEPTLVRGLGELGYDAEFVAAYRTVGVPVDERIKEEVAGGDIRALLVTSGSVARQIAEQLAPLPPDIVVATIGPRTALDARAAGLRVDVIAETRSADGLVEALVDHARTLGGSPS
jgi:uroporphyrinogen-III synthase